MRKRKELEEERMQFAMAVERHRSQIELKERVADEIRFAVVRFVTTPWLAAAI